MIEHRSKRSDGFTLIEVMIALAVFSVVAMALTKNASLAVTQTARMQDQLLAHSVAQNVLNDLLASGREKKHLKALLVSSLKSGWRVVPGRSKFV